MKPCAWMVCYGQDLRALFLDRERALQFAVNTHGRMVELFAREPI